MVMVPVLVLAALVGEGRGGGGVFLGEIKARPIDIISFSLGHISKSKVQTSNPSSSPTSLDTPARPADCKKFEFCGNRVILQIARAIGVVPWCWVTCWGAICEFVGAMVGCYCCGVPFEAEADLRDLKRSHRAGDRKP